MNSKNAKMEKFVSQMLDTYAGERGVNFIDVANLPMRDKILDSLELLLELRFFRAIRENGRLLNQAWVLL